MAKFLNHLEALEADQDPEERRATEKVIREFLSDTRSSSEGGGETSVTGPMLQELLLDYDKRGRETGVIGSYVEEFWSDAYLKPNSSVVLNLNPYFLLEESPDPKLAGNQIRRAASLCFASVKMASQLRNETVKPDVIRGRALCMNQFRSLFGASRVPRCRSRDTIAICDNSNHVVVMCRKQMFYFQALWPDTGDVAVDEGDLVNILEAIQDYTTKPETKSDDDGEIEKKYLNSVSGLGVLTSLGRKQWARAREELIEHSPTKNVESFKVVDSALFVLVLDDYVPKNKNEAAANMLHGSYKMTEYKTEGATRANEYQSGSCTNRWYDKLQIIVTADGGAGINFEHSAIDGHTALRFVSDIYADTVVSFAQAIIKMVPAHEGLIPSVLTANIRRAAVTRDNQGRISLDVSPKSITFNMSDAIKRKIYFAETALGDQILASDTQILEFKDYGKYFITFNKLSPDSYVQMSMMLAYYRMYGKIVCAYEPVLTKGFYHGRTEAMRPATMEAKHLCEVFCNPSSSPRDKLGALRNATIAHSKLVKECAQGKGVDRHLFALKCIAEKKGLPIPEFFRSESWRKLNHTILSTSNCGNPSLALFGFGPVVSDGYGIGYIIKKSQLHYAICSKHRQTTRYALTLESVLREMASLLQPISNTKVHDHSSHAASTSNHMSGLTMSDDSYGDIWGESSFQSTLEEGKPEMIPEAAAEQRWNIDGELLSPSITAPSNDAITPADAVITTIPKIRRKSGPRRRGSNDHVPIRPDRRCSVKTIMVSNGDFAELMKLDDEPEDKYQKAVLDDNFEEDENNGADDGIGVSENLSASIMVSLNDEAAYSNTTPEVIPEAAAQPRWNIDSEKSNKKGFLPRPSMERVEEFVSPPSMAPLNDDTTPDDADVTNNPNVRRTSELRRRERLMSSDNVPVRPDRRTSGYAIMVSKGDFSELMKLDDEPEEKSAPIKEV